MKNKIKRIAVMTSGGDAPGLNAAIRAVVRSAIGMKLEVLAIHDGYEGMINGNFSHLDAGSVSNIIQRGGTIIKTSRSERFKKEKWRKVAVSQLQQHTVDGVILIGGNGSFAGASMITSDSAIPFIGIPKTIDNDVYGTDYAIGFDTATNTALEAIDKLRDTADSHHRLFFVEVMGRNKGFIALHCGLSAGAEAILLPECDTNMSDLIARLEKGWERNKSSLIVVVAEGAVKGGLDDLAKQVSARFKHFDIRTSVLGHVQRGGNPSCRDRLLASLLGYEAVKALVHGKRNVVVGFQKECLTYTPFKRAASLSHNIQQQWIGIANLLSH